MKQPPGFILKDQLLLLHKFSSEINMTPASSCSVVLKCFTQPAIYLIGTFSRRLPALS